MDRIKEFDLYLGSIAPTVKNGGQIGIVVPGIAHEFETGLPEHVAPCWERDFWSFHRPAWWRRLWEWTAPVEVVRADMLPDGWRQWLRWQEVCRDFGYPLEERQVEMLRVDAGRNLDFTRAVARAL